MNVMSSTEAEVRAACCMAHSKAAVNLSTHRPRYCALVLTPKVSFQRPDVLYLACSNLIVLKVFSSHNPDLRISKPVSRKETLVQYSFHWGPLKTRRPASAQVSIRVPAWPTPLETTMASFLETSPCQVFHPTYILQQFHETSMADLVFLQIR